MLRKGVNHPPRDFESTAAQTAESTRVREDELSKLKRAMTLVEARVRVTLNA